MFEPIQRVKYFNELQTHHTSLRQSRSFLNQQQLQTARAVLWHQNAQPLLTHQDAAEWLETAGLCLFLPRHAQLPAPAPSFVEACLGQASATPAASAITHAMELAAPLIEAGRMIPLSLLGTFSEQPDFLVSAESLRWAAAVRGDRNWKSAPGGRTAPIVVRTWEILERQGTSTAADVREELGREATEGAALRALIELWSSFRAAPTYVSGQATRWSLLKLRHAKELTAASNTAQPTALSALVSLYLRSAVAATAEETEIFLSPLTSRSRIREVVHGMMAARQLATTAVGAQTLVFVEGSLEEVLPEAEPVEAEEADNKTAAPEPELAHGPAAVREGGRREREWKPGQRALGQQRSGQRKEWKPGKGREEKRGTVGFRREERRGEAAAGAGPRKEFRGGERREETGEKRGTFQRRERKPFGQKRPWQKSERLPRRFGDGKEERGAGRPGEAPRGPQQPWKRREQEEGRQQSRGREDRSQRRDREERREQRDRPRDGQRGNQSRGEQRREGGWKPFRRRVDGEGPAQEGGARRPASFGRKERSPRPEGSESGDRRKPGRSGLGDRGQRFSKGGPKPKGGEGGFKPGVRPRFSGKKFSGSKSTGEKRQGSDRRAEGATGARRFSPGRPGAGKQSGRGFGEGQKRFGAGKGSHGGKFGGSGRPERGRPPGKEFRKGRGRRADENPHKEENPQ